MFCFEWTFSFFTTERVGSPSWFSGRGAQCLIRGTFSQTTKWITDWNFLNVNTKKWEVYLKVKRSLELKHPCSKKHRPSTNVPLIPIFKALWGSSVAVSYPYIIYRQWAGRQYCCFSIPAFGRQEPKGTVETVRHVSLSLSLLGNFKKAWTKAKVGNFGIF